jgi:hypothetical protein
MKSSGASPLITMRSEKKNSTSIDLFPYLTAKLAFFVVVEKDLFLTGKATYRQDL